MKTRILIVEDENLIRWSLKEHLEERDFEIAEAEDGAGARELWRAQTWDLILLDIKLPDANGLELLREIKQHDTDTPVVMMTAYSSIESVVEAMKRGAADYITKPFNLDEVTITVQKALELTALRREVRGLRASFAARYGFDKIIGQSGKMTRVLEIAKTVAESEAETVLILGESGTGKNLIAQAIHYNSRRAANPFMDVSCTAIPEQLLESELFGHERGAFTDARATKKGLCEMADNGTLFLDEIGDMPLGIQAKLLTFLEGRSFRRVGGTRAISVNVRVIAATNQNMLEYTREKRFREDLYYRLNVIEITMPPLRERKADIPLLTRFFIDHFNRKFNKKIRDISEEAVYILVDYPWPGNVRELRNVVERAMILSKHEVIKPDDILLRPNAQINSGPAGDNLISLPEEGIAIDTVERDLVEQALEKTKGNQTRAAKLLRLSRDQLRYRMKQYGMLD